MKITKIVFFISLLAIIFFGGREIYLNLQRPDNIRAFGDLKVFFGNPPVPPGDPIFTLDDFKPGDCEEREIKVANFGTDPHLIAVRGERTGGIGDDPILENVLDFLISESGTDLYGGSTGTKTVADFFTDSTDPNSIKLNTISAGFEKTYKMKVCFPKEAGNEYQKKSVIFDILFENFESGHIVINEIYYWPDKEHGTDGKKICPEAKAENKNTAEGSVNNSTVIINNNTQSTTNQSTIVNNNVETQGQGNTTIIIDNDINNSTTIVSGCGHNDEWVELYNPTDKSVNLKNWSLTDNNKKVTINSNKIINAKSFALISKSASTWNKWSGIPNGTLKIELGKIIGNSLDNSGDRLILKNPLGKEIDSESWGTDSYFVHLLLIPTQGKSFSRLVAGIDTDSPSDFINQFLPTPGF